MANRTKCIAEIVARAEGFMRSGLIKAARGTPVPKREGRGRNRGRGLAFQWLCQHVDWDDEACLIWPYAKNCGFPASVGYCGKIYKPSRLMCLLAKGAPPSTKHQASYICGGGKAGCINPAHLSWKTQSEFRREKARDGRKNPGKGGKITPTEAAEIRAIGSTKSLIEVSKLYGLSPQRICSIRKGHGFIRPRKAWYERDGRFYSRIGHDYQQYSLGSFATPEQASAAYYEAFLALRRGDPPAISLRSRAPLTDEQRAEEQADLQRFYTDQASAFGDGAEFGRRIPIVVPTQQLAEIEFLRNLDNLHPKVKDFVLAMLRCEDVEEAATYVGFNAATVSMLMPRLHRFLQQK